MAMAMAMAIVSSSGVERAPEPTGGRLRLTRNQVTGRGPVDGTMQFTSVMIEYWELHPSGCSKTFRALFLFKPGPVRIHLVVT